jgi:hypothetical protein
MKYTLLSDTTFHPQREKIHICQITSKFVFIFIGIGNHKQEVTNRLKINRFLSGIPDTHIYFI